MSFGPIDEADLIHEVEARVEGFISQSRSLIVSIDGLGGTGKTMLARALTAQFDGTILSFDDYLIPHQGTYLSNLRYPDLSSDLADAEERGTSVIILEGLCALAVLERLDRNPDVAIYIRRVDEYGQWADEFYYSEHNDLNDILRSFDDIEARYPDKPGIADSDRELVRYHIETKPISRADFVLNRQRSLPPSEASSA